MGDKRNLSEAELEIMMIIWHGEEKVTSKYIQERLQGKRGWALSTLMTVLNRLIDKGFLVCDRSTRTNYYSALVSEKQYKASEGKSILERLFDNSLKSLVAGLVDEKSVSEEEIQELREFLDSIKEE